MDTGSGKSERIATSIARAGSGLLRIVGITMLVYVVGMTIFAISKFSTTKSTLLSYGLSDATGTLIAWAVMCIAIGVPGLAIVRLFFFHGRPYDYAAVMLLPLISWGMVQIPANFDAVSGEALKFCASRPDNTLFCLDRPGIDPVTQKKLVAMNSSIAELEFRKNKGLVPRRITQPVPEIAFFDPLTAEPRVWVRKNDQGCFDLFDNPGADIQTGEHLSPITKEIVRTVQKCGNPAARNQGQGKRIVAQDVVIPAKGTIAIKKERRCYVDSFTKELMNLGITLSETNSEVRYQSTHSAEILGKIWFFDEGGDCIKDYLRLRDAQAFL